MIIEGNRKSNEYCELVGILSWSSPCSLSRRVEEARSDDGKILHGGCETVLMMTFALVVAVMAMFFAICFCDMRANGHK